MGKRISSAFSFTDSLLTLDSVIPGGTSPSKLADDIFNDPLSWQGPDLVDEVVQEIEKEKRVVNREASVFLDKPLTGLLNLTPNAPEFKIESLKGSHKSIPKPIKLFLNGDNLHQWDDDLPSRKSTRTPKDLGKELNKRMTRLFTHGIRSTFPSPLPKHSPLDAPVSATGPYTPPLAGSKRFSLNSPGLGFSASATWNILKFYAPHQGDATVPKTAGLPSKPQSARQKIPPVPRIPPPLPSAPAKKKTFPTVALPPTPMKTSSAAGAAAGPQTPMKTSSTATLTPSTAAMKTSTTMVATPLTATSSLKSARRPLPTIPGTFPTPTPTKSGFAPGLQRSNTTRTVPSTPPPAPAPRAKSEVHPKRRVVPAHPPIPDNAVELIRKRST